MLEQNTGTQTHDTKEVTTAFKWFHATSLNWGAMLVAATIGSYFSVYMTDTVGIPAGTAAMIMFIATLWDAINDPIMGAVVDRTQTRWGRYRPYFTIFPVIAAVVAVLLFANPQGLTLNQKVIYITVLYIMWGTLFTILTMPQMAILPATTRDNTQRNKVIALGAMFMSLSFTTASSFTIPMTEFFGGSFVPVMMIYGLIMIITYWGLFATSKERYLSPVQKRPIKQELKSVFRHKELYPIILIWCLASIGYSLMYASSVYYMMYYMSRPDLIPTYMFTISMGSLTSMAILMPLALKWFKTGQRALIVTQAITAVLYLILFLFGSNLVVLFIVSYCATAIGAMSNALVNILVNDTIDFMQLKEGASLNGTISSLKGFAQKCGSTVVNSGILVVLGATGYIAGAIGGQPQATMTALNILRFGIPATICVILVIALKHYPLEKYYPAIEEMKKNMAKANK